MEKICTIVTKDQKQYKIDIDLLRKYSSFFDVMIDDQNADQLQPIKLEYISSSAFDYIYEFMQLHKVNPPKQVSKPIVKGINLNTVMSEQDAQLMDRINDLSSQMKVQIMNGAVYLQIQSFKKHLTYAIMKKQLQRETQVNKVSQDLQNEIRNQISAKINSLIEMQNHRKRLQQQNYEVPWDFNN